MLAFEQEPVPGEADMNNEDSRSRIARRALQAVVLALAAATLILPVALAPVNFIKTTAMLGYALIFQNVMTGSAGLPFYRLYNAKHVSKYHMVTGLTGFTLALVHGIVILVDRTMSVYNWVWILGPIALVLLAVTITTALLRKRFRKAWRRIHQANYLIFAALTVKALVIGSVINSTTALMIIVYVYAGLAVVGLCYRLYRYFSLRRKKAARAAASS